MALGDVYHSKVTYDVEGISASNTFFVREVTESTNADKTTDVILAVTNEIVTPIRGVQANVVQLCKIEAWGIDVDVPPELNLYEDLIGLVVGDAIPANKNAKVILRQNLFSSRANGELRIAGIPEIDITGNVYDGAITRAVQWATLSTALTTSITHGGAGAGVYEVVIRTDGAEAQATGVPPIYNKCVQANVQALVYSDRRRTSRHMGVFNT